MGFFQAFLLRRSASASEDIANIRVASPCPARWEQMVGDESMRHCSECNLNVYHLSAMTADAVKQLIETHRDRRLCVRFYRREDGTVLTQNCPWSLRMMARKASRLASAVLTALMSVTVAAARTKGPKPTCECRLIQQKDSGISLVVLDQHGAVIPKAEITLQKQSASETIADVTGTSGEWNHGILAAGQYQITVKSPGFRTFSSIIEVRNGARLALKIKLPVADVKVMVEVKAEPTEVVGIATVGILAETKTSPLPPMLSEGQRFPMQP